VEDAEEKSSWAKACGISGPLEQSIEPTFAVDDPASFLAVAVPGPNSHQGHGQVVGRLHPTRHQGFHHSDTRQRFDLTVDGSCQYSTTHAFNKSLRGQATRLSILPK